MGQVEVADHGREIVIFLSGDIAESDREALSDSIDAITIQERLSDLDLAIVDMHKVTSFGPAGVAFLHQLQDRGERLGFGVSFATLSGPAHRALEEAGWGFIEHSPPE